ncbi:MAG: hypothetical protein HY646_18365 [Acidobacteria bacterium]|nr:hypothetical protein [Acidobacteriota bacterium]
MQHQLDFWPAARKAPYEQGPWESLSLEEQAETIERLARLIAKAVCPQLIDQIQENNHEQ